jgi:hypothetical protein
VTDLELKEKRAESILRRAYREGDVIVVRTKLGNLRVDYRWQTYAVISLKGGGVLRSGKRSHVKKFLVSSCLVVERNESIDIHAGAMSRQDHGEP